MKNLLFASKKTHSKEDLRADASPPMCPKTGKPMKKVICGTHTGKQFYTWVSPEAHLVLPAFK
jgi:hypothetical protein